MTITVDEVILKLSNAFNEIFDDYKGMYLFGVCVDGKIHKNEDIELAALFDIEDQQKRNQIWPIIGKIETENDVCIDLYPFTENSFKNSEVYDEVIDNGIFYNKKGEKNG